MKAVVFMAALLIACPAFAAKDCEALKSKIDNKVQSKGVKAYTLEIVAKDAETGALRVVGSCDGGSKKITYKRG